MIKLSETDLQLKEDLDKIISGGYDSYLSPEQIEMALELSFLFNFTKFDNVGVVEFSYDGFSIRISGLNDLFFGGLSIDEAKDAIVYQIRSEEKFKSALLSYKRDYKLNKLVEMTTIEKRIEADFLSAFKSKKMELKTLLGTIKGEMQTLKKNLVVENLSDDESIKLLTKFAKGTKETIALLEKSNPSSDAIKSARFELDVLESYLPKQMSESEINQKLEEILASGVTNIGLIMKEFAQLPADKKVVSELARKKMA